MAFYSDDWLDEVRQRSDIVEIVSEHVQLRQNGRRYLGLCPFHGEKTPSFSVDAEKQFYYCFGCHAGGNVFRFVMAIENMDFPEAARHLAERAHMSIPQSSERNDGPSREHKDRLYAALTEAARWYHKRLYAPEGAAALDYLHRRGLGDNTIRRFGLGATGDGWENLTTALTGMGYTRKELEDANLCAVRGDRSFDMFRSRAMFPIFDARGRVVAFGGRILGDGQPKYLNSSDTPVFSKSRTVYGLNFIKGSGTLYLLEGYMDVVSLAQHGIKGGVASLGTALTSDQVRLIKRKAGDQGEIVIVYDGDAAGQRAIRRAIDLFAVQNVPCRIAVIPDGQDPDDYVKQYGGQAFEQLPRKRPPEYLMDCERDTVDLSSLDGRTSYAKAAAGILRTVESPIELETYVKRLEIETGFSRDALYEQIGRMPKTRLASQPVGNTRNQVRDTNTDKEPDHVKAQQHLVSMLAEGNADEKAPVSVDDFSDPLCREMAQALLSAKGDPLAVSRLMDSIEDEQKRARVGAILALERDANPDIAKRQIRDYLMRIRRHQLDEQIAEVTDRIQREDNPQGAVELHERLKQLMDAHASLRFPRSE